MDLAKANDLKLEEGIKPGLVLKIPDNQIIAKQTTGNSKATGYTIHEVKSSETLYSVARKYGVTIKDIMEWNNKNDFSVSVGEQLRIQEK
jgi:membrane-bound lytic murein transglycosylase D